MKRWYLVYCKRGDQPRAKQQLENQGVECYYPQITVIKKVRGQSKQVTEPLFPSYVFVRFDYEQGPSFTTIRSTRGVSDFIRFGSYPHELQGDLIFHLKQVEQQMHEATTTPEVIKSPEVGSKVTIATGQFSGLEAIYQQKDGEHRSMLLISMLNQTVPVSIDNADLDRSAD